MGKSTLCRTVTIALTALMLLCTLSGFVAASADLRAVKIERISAPAMLMVVPPDSTRYNGLGRGAFHALRGAFSASDYRQSSCGAFFCPASAVSSGGFTPKIVEFSGREESVWHTRRLLRSVMEGDGKK